MTPRTISSHSAALPALSPLGVVGMIMAALDIWRERRALERLDADRLSDLGIDPEEALREAKKPIWDAPNSWRC